MSPSRKQPAPSTSPDRPPQESFEAAYAELQSVVQRLEGGGLDLEQSLALAQRGTQLADACDRLIASAELRLTRLPAESATPLSDLPADT